MGRQGGKLLARCMDAMITIGSLHFGVKASIPKLANG